MPLPLQVRREVLLPSPGPHRSSWLLNPSPTSPDGPGLVATRVVIETGGLGHRRWQEWTDTVQRVVSADGGATWTGSGPIVRCPSYASGGAFRAWHHLLCPTTGRLLSLHETGSGEDGRRLTFLHSQVSLDAGATWSPPEQVVTEGGDATHWLPGVADGRWIGVDQGPLQALADGTIVFGLTVHDPNQPMGVTFLRGRWRDETTLDWCAGETIRAPRSVSTIGCCEPDLLVLADGRLVTTLRCQGNRAAGVPSSRQMAVSVSGGATWSEPRALTYEDGEPVHVPASLAAFERGPDGRAYWLANILDHPVYGQLPRYPLAVARFDEQRLCLVRETVTVVQDLPPGAPEADDEAGELGRRYSNFGHLVDRETGELVLYLAEEPKVDWDEGSADCLRYRIRIG